MAFGNKMAKMATLNWAVVKKYLKQNYQMENNIKT